MIKYSALKSYELPLLSLIIKHLNVFSSANCTLIHNELYTIIPYRNDINTAFLTNMEDYSCISRFSWG